MIKKLIFLAVCTFVTINATVCQVNKVLKGFKNDSIKFQVYRTSVYFVGDNKVTEPKILIEVSMSNSEAKKVRKIKPQAWLSALNDPDFDWAANLLLYDIYKKDATVFEVIDNREKWMATYKDNDINFWRRKFNNSE